MANVELSAVRKSFGAVEVIHGLDMQIADGEFVNLVGPSGCGKSTLLQMIAGLEDISSGTVSIADRVVNALTPKERNIAMVFQNYALYPQMTVAQNLGFSLEISGVSRADIRKKVEATAEILGLTPMLARKPSQLSGGQRQRVAMGRAIIRDPDVFLFDEPLSNLDANPRVQMRAEIKALHQRLGTTIVYVTHDQIEAMTMADRIVVLRDGNVEQIGTPLGLYDCPANKFVASFLGSPSMNFLQGRQAEDGSPFLILPDQSRVRVHARPATPRSENVVMGIRPQDIFEDPDDGIPATIQFVEPTGADIHVTVHVAGRLLTCVLPPRLGKNVGDEIRLSLATPNAHFFDPISEARL